MRLVVDPKAWRDAGLSFDAGALAWLDRLEPQIAWLELLGEGQLRYHRLLSGGPSFENTYAACHCDREFLSVRRRYTGPVPAQVLAAFRPDQAVTS